VVRRPEDDDDDGNAERSVDLTKMTMKPEEGAGLAK
jgi:hypothetical protein